MAGNIEDFKVFQTPKENIVEQIIKEAWFYPRVSSKNQYENNHSLENQSKVSHAYARDNGISITREFGGTYESAKGDFTRKEFMRLINEIKRSRKRPKYVLIYIMSRFSRTGGNAISLANMLVEELGVHLVETSSGLSTETDEGKLAIYQKLLEARKETISRLESIIPGMKTALLNGKWIGAVPRGYTKYGPNVTEEKRFAARTRIEVNEEGEVMRKAWQMKLRGERDYIIKDMLKESGLEFTLKQLHKLWQKPFYAGIIINKMIEEPVKGDWEPLISPEDFITINKGLKENKWTVKGYKRNDEINNPRPLNGDLYCGECGNKLYGYEKRKKRANGEINTMHYYACFKCRKVHVSAHSSKFSKFEGIHEQFMGLLKNYNMDEKYHDAIAQNIVKIAQARDEEDRKRIPQIKKRISELKEEFKAIKKRWAIGKIPDSDYEEYKQEYADEITKLEEKLPNNEISTTNLLKMTKVIVKGMQNLDKVWDSVGYTSKRELQNILFPKGLVVNPENRQLRTFSTSFLLSVMLTLRDGYRDNKKGMTDKIINQSLSAEKEGFEPPEV